MGKGGCGAGRNGDAGGRFNPAPHAGRHAALRKQWGIPSSALVVGFVGASSVGACRSVVAFEEVVGRIERCC